MGFGDQFGPQIRKALTAMDMFVPFVTLDPLYGNDSGGTYTTYFELQFAHEHKTPLCPILMYEGPDGQWPPTKLRDALLAAGDEDGAAMVMFSFLPSLITHFAPKRTDWNAATAKKIAQKIARSIGS